MKTKEVLLIEDNELARKAFALNLQSMGFRVWEASNVDQLLDLVFDGCRAPVVVSDVHLQGLSGAKALSQVRAALPLAKLIAITGAFVPGQENLNADRVLRKPFEMYDLGAAINDLLAE